jgi:hypothetical protein
MTSQAVLIKAAELIESSPTAWAQDALARTADGKKKTSPRNPSACSWCAMGAIAKVQNLPDAPRAYNPAAKLLAVHLGVTSIANWNDHPLRTRDEVINGLRSAAKSVWPSRCS